MNQDLSHFSFQEIQEVFASCLTSDGLDIDCFVRFFPDLFSNNTQFATIFPELYQFVLSLQCNHEDVHFSIYSSMISHLINKHNFFSYFKVNHFLETLYDTNSILFLTTSAELTENIIDIFQNLGIGFFRQKHLNDNIAFTEILNISKCNFAKSVQLQLIFNFLFLESARHSGFVCGNTKQIIHFISSHYIDITYFISFFDPKSKFEIFYYLRNLTETRLMGLFIAYIAIYKFSFFRELEFFKLYLFDQVKFKSSIFSLINDAEILAGYFKYGQAPGLISSNIFRSKFSSRQVSSRFETMSKWKAENIQVSSNNELSIESSKSKEIKNLKAMLRSKDAELRWTRKSLDNALKEIQDLKAKLDMNISNEESSIITEMMMHKRENFNYSSEYIDFSYIIYSLSPRAFQYLKRAGVPLPDERTIDRHFSYKKSKLKNHFMIFMTLENSFRYFWDQTFTKQLRHQSL